MAFKMRGFSAFTKQTDPPSGQDIVKPKDAQIKDLQNDIIKLKERNNPGDNKRIKILEDEIKRLQG